MVNELRSNRSISLLPDRRTHTALLLLKKVQVTVVMILFLISAATVHAQNTFVVMSPEYSSCGNVSINGVVDTTPPMMGLVWDWGDGSKTTSWFPATHRYTSNGDFTVTVSAAGCNTLTQTSPTHAWCVCSRRTTAFHSLRNLGKGPYYTTPQR
jgi:hypothetical protein